MAIKGIIFDYGGTLDSRGEHWSEVIYRAYTNAGLCVDKTKFREAYVEGERALARQPIIQPQHNFLDIMLCKIDIELHHLESNGTIASGYATRYTEPIAQYCYAAAGQCVAESAPILSKLHGQFPLGMVSNFYGNLNTVLSDFNIAQYFVNVTESSVVGKRKPDPEIFAIGIKTLGLCPDEVIVVGDSYSKDIVPAESLGCKTVWLKGKGWTDEEDSITHKNTIKSIENLPQAIFTIINQ